MMKEIVMDEYRCDDKGWHKTGTKTFHLVSRWIKVQHNYNPTKRNALWCYVMDENGYKPSEQRFNPDSDLYLDYFKWNGRTYALEQFLSYSNPFWNPVSYGYKDENRYPHFLSGVDMENIYSPISVEFDEYCEHVRVYEEA